MKKPEIPFNENERMAAIDGYSILDTLPEKDFDDITSLASQICQTPISLITIVDKDRQWFKSHHGLEVSETPRDYSFCAHAINNPQEILIVPDARKDSRFIDNPLVTDKPHVIFYTGVPLLDSKGLALGTLCVIDDHPRELDQKQIDALRALAKQIMKLFELRKANQELERARTDLENRNRELDEFARIAAHDIKSPLNDIISISKILQEDYAKLIDEEGHNFLNFLQDSSNQLKNLVDGILSYSRSSQILSQKKEEIVLSDFFTLLMKLMDFNETYQIKYPQTNQTICTNRTALNQIFINLITNSVKYNDKEEIVIEISFSENQYSYLFFVKDNGPGIAEKNINKIFNMFQVLQSKDRLGEKGHGLGLSIVKRLVEGLGGSIQVSSELGLGTTFNFSLPKS